MAAITTTTTQVAPNSGYKLIVATGTSAADGDTMTIPTTTLHTIKGCIGFSTTGVPASYSINATTGVITINNGGTLIWNFIVWGI